MKTNYLLEVKNTYVHTSQYIKKNTGRTVSPGQENPTGKWDKHINQPGI